MEQRADTIASEVLRDLSQRYRLGDELGAGAQATVYRATHKKSGRKLAIKLIDLSELADDEVYDALQMEVSLLRQLNHPHIVDLVEVVRDSKFLYIVQEALAGGELFDQLLAKGPFREDYALAIFAQVALAVDHMHASDVVHRDLKAENLVFAAKGSPVIKFIDFGGASTCAAGGEGLVGLVGTPQYVAPEVVTGFGEVAPPTEEPYGKPCDLWSMGVLLYVMLSKTMPFRAKEVDQLLRQVVKGRFAFRPEERWLCVSSHAKDLIQKLLQVDPAKRLTIEQVKSHPWAADAIAKCEAALPSLEARAKQAASARGGGGGALFPRVKLFKKGESKIGRKKRVPGQASKEQQYWYAHEISPPTGMQQVGGVKVSTDGSFQLENVAPEVREMLQQIAQERATKEGGGDAIALVPFPEPAALSHEEASQLPPPPPEAHAVRVTERQPPRGDFEASAELTRLSAETTAFYRAQNDGSETLETLMLVRQKDEEIAALETVRAELEGKVAELLEQVSGLQLSANTRLQAVPPPPDPSHDEERASLEARLAAALERAESAESKLEVQLAANVKLQAKLGAVTSLYTEAMQREAVLKVNLDQAKASAAEA